MVTTTGKTEKGKMDGANERITLAVLKTVVALDGKRTREVLVALERKLDTVCDEQRADHERLVVVEGKASDNRAEIGRLRSRDATGTLITGALAALGAIMGALGWTQKP